MRDSTSELRIGVAAALLVWAGAGCAHPQRTSRTWTDVPAAPATSPAPPSRSVTNLATTEVIRGVPAAEEPRSDEEIGLEIRRRLSAGVPNDSAGVIVELNDGIVTLRGFAPSQQALWRVEGIARAVRGVKQVYDNVIVRTPPPVH